MPGKVFSQPRQEDRFRFPGMDLAILIKKRVDQKSGGCKKRFPFTGREPFFIGLLDGHYPLLLPGILSKQYSGILPFLSNKSREWSEFLACQVIAADQIQERSLFTRSGQYCSCIVAPSLRGTAYPAQLHLFDKPIEKAQLAIQAEQLLEILRLKS